MKVAELGQLVANCQDWTGTEEEGEDQRDHAAGWWSACGSGPRARPR